MVRSNSNSNGNSSNSRSNRGDWNAPIHCRKFVCRSCKCRHYPDCSFGDADDNFHEMCEDCFDGEWGCHKATKDMPVLAANPLYDPARCGISRPLHNFDTRMVARRGNSRAALANLHLTNAQLQNLQQKRARLHQIGRSVFGGRLSPRGRRLLAAMNEYRYRPNGNGNVYRQLQQQYAGGLGSLENMTLGNRLRQLRNSRRRRSPNVANIPLSRRLNQLRNSRRRRSPNVANIPLSKRLKRRR